MHEHSFLQQVFVFHSCHQQFFSKFVPLPLQVCGGGSAQAQATALATAVSVLMVFRESFPCFSQLFTWDNLENAKRFPLIISKYIFLTLLTQFLASGYLQTAEAPAVASALAWDNSECKVTFLDHEQLLHL